MKSSAPVPAPEAVSSSAQTTWKLVAPDWAELDTIWQNDLPFVLWPIGNQPLLAHWMDEAVRRGVDLVELYVADRPAEVRAWLDEGAYWSRRVLLIPISDETQAPADAQRTDHLPGISAPPSPSTLSALPTYWFALQEQWLAQRSAETVAVERLHPSGGWVGAHARIHPSARLTPPFWIGRRVRIGPNCEIGPNALIAEGAILDRNVSVAQASVQAHTYLGCNTRLCHSAADGNVLLDFRRSCRVEISERFIMGPVSDDPQPGFFSRLLALLCWLILSPLSLFWPKNATEDLTVRCRNGETISLPVHRRGPLFLRRVSWLKHIAAGRMFWIGVLPRRMEDLAQVPEETGRALQNAPTGMFSLADVHGCHDTADPEEWIHAAYQASAAGSDAASVVTRNLWKIAWSRKTSSSLA
jgi:hypothetical protein